MFLVPNYDVMVAKITGLPEPQASLTTVFVRCHDVAIARYFNRFIDISSHVISNEDNQAEHAHYDPTGSSTIDLEELICRTSLPPEYYQRRLASVPVTMVNPMLGVMLVFSYLTPE